MEEKKVSLRRLNYFTGQLLDEEDFRVEQDYHLEGRRRHLRRLHTPGVSGLEVSTAGPRTLQVAPGYAVDALGREIVLDDTIALAASDVAPNASAYVTVEYGETVQHAEDPRTVEYAIVRVRAAPPPPDGTALLLARIPVDAKGVFGEPDMSGRPSPGVRLAAASVGTAELARGAVTAEKLDAGLRGGWVRLPFKPSAFYDTSGAGEFQIGATRTFSPVAGAKGTVAIPVPPGVVLLKQVVVAGERNQAGIELIVYQCGWDVSTRRRLEIASPPIAVPGTPGDPFTRNIELNWTLDARMHAVALFVHAKGSAEINFVGAEFG
jgi:hypothetical protein